LSTSIGRGRKELEQINYQKRCEQRHQTELSMQEVALNKRRLEEEKFQRKLTVREKRDHSK
jgi:hypothetical protein